MLTASKAVCPITKPLTGVLIFKVGRIHTTGGIEELLSIHKVASIDGDTPHEEVPFSPPLRLGNGGQHLGGLSHTAQVDQLTGGDKGIAAMMGLAVGLQIGRAHV